MYLYVNKRKLWNHAKDLDLLKLTSGFADIPASFTYCTVTDEESLQALRWRHYVHVR